MTNIMDETYTALADHIAASDAQLTAMTGYAFATHAISYGVTFPRMLFTSVTAESGKTHAMLRVADLSATPMDTSGTSYAFQSGLMAATNEPEKDTPTLYRDEISDVFGQSGMSGNNNPIAEILRKGYKRGATRSASVNRVKVEYNIFTPFLMTGLRTAVPTDIRTRCIVISMEPGTPRKYFDVRESEPYFKALQSAISTHVKGKRDEITRFRARGLHPKLTNRKLEVWEPLLAVAYAVGGEQWLTRMVRAFAELSLDERDTPALTPRQMITRDAASAAQNAGTPFITAGAIADDMRRTGNALYADRTEHSLVCLIRDNIAAKAGRKTIDGVQQRVYRSADLIAAWDEIKPAELADIDMPEDSDDMADCEDWD